MFTDVIGSTATASKVGEQRWKELVEQHHAVAAAFVRAVKNQVPVVDR